ncbi:MAG: hypothetical protein LE180_06680, partial [Endomicrobium sp.]|uniref:hypothetical protein n=1 Tax=Candidatus Endomicrobiellum pyrsonymphae TaxID=1408203 RepID=UPI003574EA8F|nr:hypothetical protein [Endomicrobium sp.]
MVNFKKMVSVVVVFSLVLSSCGGNKNSGSGVSGLGRNVALNIFENDIKTVGTAGDVVQDVSAMKLVGSRFEMCDLDNATGETVCVNKGDTSTVRFKSMKYGDELLNLTVEVSPLFTHTVSPVALSRSHIKTVGTAGDVVQDVSAMKLVGSRFEMCDLDNATGETV